MQVESSLSSHKSVMERYDLKQRFKIIRIIGRGTYGRIYLAEYRDERLSSRRGQVAVKRIECFDLNVLNDAMNEILQMQNLHHPSIILYHETFISQDDGTEDMYINIVMELIEGGDLQTVFGVRDCGKKCTGVIEKLRNDPNILVPLPGYPNKRKVDEYFMIELVDQVSNGLFFLHNKNIIHRDISPKNLMVMKKQKGVNKKKHSKRKRRLTSTEEDSNSFEYVFKIVDFGCVRRIENSLPNTQVGTILYLSPEISSAQKYDVGTDIWSMGAVCFNLMLLEEMNVCYHFLNNKGQENYSKIRKRLIFERGYSESLTDLVLDMLVISRDRRISADEITRRIKEIKKEHLSSEKNYFPSFPMLPKKDGVVEEEEDDGEHISISLSTPTPNNKTMDEETLRRKIGNSTSEEEEEIEKPSPAIELEFASSGLHELSVELELETRAVPDTLSSPTLKIELPSFISHQKKTPVKKKKKQEEEEEEEEMEEMEDEFLEFASPSSIPQLMLLPSEILVLIFQYLDMSNIPSLSRTCQFFRVVGLMDEYWKLVYLQKYYSLPPTINISNNRNETNTNEDLSVVPRTLRNFSKFWNLPNPHPVSADIQIGITGLGMNRISSPILQWRTLCFHKHVLRTNLQHGRYERQEITTGFKHRCFDVDEKLLVIGDTNGRLLFFEKRRVSKTEKNNNKKTEVFTEDRDNFYSQKSRNYRKKKFSFREEMDGSDSSCSDEDVKKALGEDEEYSFVLRKITMSHHHMAIRGIQICRDEGLLISCGEDSSIQLRSLVRGVYSLLHEKRKSKTQRLEWYRSILFVPELRKLFVGDLRYLRIFSLNNGTAGITDSSRTIYTHPILEFEKRLNVCRGEGVYSITLGPDRRRIFLRSDRTIRVYSINEPYMMLHEVRHNHQIWGFGISSDRIRLKNREDQRNWNWNRNEELVELLFMGTVEKELVIWSKEYQKGYGSNPNEVDKDNNGDIKDDKNYVFKIKKRIGFSNSGIISNIVVTQNLIILGFTRGSIYCLDKRKVLSSLFGTDVVEQKIEVSNNQTNVTVSPTSSPTKSNIRRNKKKRRNKSPKSGSLSMSLSPTGSIGPNEFPVVWAKMIAKRGVEEMCFDGKKLYSLIWKKEPFIILDFSKPMKKREGVVRPLQTQVKTPSSLERSSGTGSSSFGKRKNRKNQVRKRENSGTTPDENSFGFGGNSSGRKNKRHRYRSHKYNKGGKKKKRGKKNKRKKR